MIENRLPVEIGNAENFNRKALTESKITMIRLEDTFNFLSEEPISITVKEKEESKSIYMHFEGTFLAAGDMGAHAKKLLLEYLFK